ncbi:MAG: V-type ATP synthase subunit I [Acutalibacteraceae bacterium]|jgi:V/A-type H+-transporting ATPase subunit I
MKRLTVVGPLDRLDDAMEICGESGVFHPEDALSFYSDTKDFSPIREENPYGEALGRLKTAIRRIGGTPRLTRPSPLPADRVEEYVAGFEADADRAAGETDRWEERARTLAQEIEQFEHLKGLNVELSSLLECQTIKVRFGRLPAEGYDKLALYDDDPYVMFFTAGREKHYYWGMYFAPLDFVDAVDRIFSGLYFERVRLPAETGTVEEILAHLRKEHADAEQALKTARADAAALWEKEKDACLEAYTAMHRREYLFGLRRYAAKYHDEFIVTGWVPAAEQKALADRFAPIDGVKATFEAATVDERHTPPVKLRNWRLFRPFEFLVDMYGMPRYGEIDPTPFVAITYVLLFGIMFGDVGQGLLVSLVGWLMWRLKKLDIGRVLIPCGISSAVFGLVYGSVFGFEHWLDPLYKAVLGLDEKPVEVMRSSMTTTILLASVGIGIVLIVVSMALGIYSGIRQKNWEAAFFSPSGLAGMVFYLAVIVGCVLQFVLGVPVMTTWYVLGLIVLPLIVMFLRQPLGKLAARDPDWKPDGWGDFILQNFFELFETMLSYLSNTMSFLRVGAFVLVHAGMMMAVFALADLFGPFGATVTVVIGNALVMVMEATLVAIQVMRLEFYEMFSRYYNGDGQIFTPLSAQADS